MGGIKYKFYFGEMAEWLIAPVLKTGIVRNKELSRVRIPLSPLYSVNKFVAFLYFIGFARLSSIKEIGSIKGNGSAKWDSRARKKKKKKQI